MIANDPVADTESETGALADVARREERIEYAREIRAIDAMPGVFHEQLDGTRVLVESRADVEPLRRTPAHRPLGVEHQIQQRLLQLTPVGNDLGQRRLKLRDQLDAIQAKFVRAERHHTT